MPTDKPEKHPGLPTTLDGPRLVNTKAYAHFAHLCAEVLFQGKWQVQILCAMRLGPVRIGHLGRLIPGASKKVLTQGLRRLEFQGIVVRTDLSDFVLHVEYELHPQARESVGELLDRVAQWGEAFAIRKAKSEN